jgi:glycerol-3-phosphate dehydrogenase
VFDTDNVYVFQHGDGRLIYASPLERDFTLVGSIVHAFTGDPAIVALDVRDVTYLCEAINRYLRRPIHPSDVIMTISGVNLVPRGGTPDALMTFHASRGIAPLITVVGGDVTSSRWRAERAISKLVPYYPMSPPWTAGAHLPGGDFAWERFDAQVDAARERWSFLREPEAHRLVGAYGTRLAEVLAQSRSRADLGERFGPDLTAAEVRYLMKQEWARFPDDILWRRSKLGLSMPANDREALAKFMAAQSGLSS